MQASVQACRGALNTYRHENAMVRTIPKPSFFDEYPIFDDKLPVIGGTNFNTRRDQILDKAKQLHQAANGALDRLHEQNNAFVSSVEADIVTAEKHADDRRKRDSTEKGSVS